jgi:hypothetical protein
MYEDIRTHNIVSSTFETSRQNIANIVQLFRQITYLKVQPLKP